MNFLQKNRPKEMSAWQDCQWRRIACGQNSCPICGPNEERRRKYIKKGEDPDSMKSALVDLSEIFCQTRQMLEDDAGRMEIDLDNLPEFEEEASPPEIFPIYNEVAEWSRGVQKIAEASDDVSSAWLYSEAGKDLLWYSRTLCAKTARQLDNFRDVEQGREYMDLECGYTGYALSEVLNILRNVIIKLIADNGPHAKKFTLAYLVLTGIEEKMRKIKV